MTTTTKAMMTMTSCYLLKFYLKYLLTSDNISTATATHHGDVWVGQTSYMETNSCL